MDLPKVTEPMMVAGRNFDADLVKLGLRAHTITWAFDTIIEEHVLIVVTDFYEVQGPLKIMQLLFQACNSSRLASNVDPFKIRIHSIDQPFIRAVMQVKNADVYGKEPDGTRIDLEIEDGTFGVGDVYFDLSWMIADRAIGKRERHSIVRQFKKFAERIEKLAA